jgi:hypothetical protein
MRAQKGATGSGDGDAAQRRRAHALACLAQCHGLHVSQVRQYSYFSTSKASNAKQSELTLSPVSLNVTGSMSVR